MKYVQKFSVTHFLVICSVWLALKYVQQQHIDFGIKMLIMMLQKVKKHVIEHF